MAPRNRRQRAGLGLAKCWKSATCAVVVRWLGHRRGVLVSVEHDGRLTGCVIRARRRRVYSVSIWCGVLRSPGGRLSSSVSWFSVAVSAAPRAAYAVEGGLPRVRGYAAGSKAAGSSLAAGADAPCGAVSRRPVAPQRGSAVRSLFRGCRPGWRRRSRRGSGHAYRSGSL